MLVYLYLKVSGANKMLKTKDISSSMVGLKERKTMGFQSLGT